MVGTVVRMEWLLGTRRGRLNGLRRLYAAWLATEFAYLFLGLVLANWLRHRHVWPPTTSFENFSYLYVDTLVLQQILVLFLATPAFVAGAVTGDKSPGTLESLFTAGLTSWDIVVGKLLARLAQVAVVGLAVVPMLCFFAGAQWLDAVLILALPGVTVAPLFAVGAVSILASVWCRQTRDAVLLTYAVCAVAYPTVLGLAHEVKGLAWLHYVDPVYVVQTWREPVEMGRRLLLFTGAWGGVGLACVGLAVWRLRPAYARQLENAGSHRTGFLGRWAGHRPPVTDDPVRWKEEHVDGLAPFRILRRVPRWCGVLGVAVVTLALDTSFDGGSAFQGQAIVALLIATLVVSVRCSGAITRERERQTWESLLLTDLEARDMVRGKFRGVLHACLPYWLAYAVPALVVSGCRSVDDLGWTGLGVLVTPPGANLVAAAGISCSARCTSSWHSLVVTLPVVFLGGFVVLVTWWLTLLIVLCCTLASKLAWNTGTSWSSFVVQALVIWGLAQWPLSWAWGRRLLSEAEQSLRRTGDFANPFRIPAVPSRLRAPGRPLTM